MKNNKILKKTNKFNQRTMKLLLKNIKKICRIYLKQIRKRKIKRKNNWINLKKIKKKVKIMIILLKQKLKMIKIQQKQKLIILMKKWQ